MFIAKSMYNRYGLALVQDRLPIAFTGYSGSRDLASMCCPWDLFGINEESIISNQIFVLPEYQGRGYGVTLLSRLCEVAREKRFNVLQIDQPKGNLMDWYSKNLESFAKSNTIRGYQFLTKDWNRFIVEL